MGTATARSLTTDRETRDLIEEAESWGYTAEKTNGGHIKFTHPQLMDPVFTSASPSDHRGVKNCRSQLKRGIRMIEQAQATVDTAVGGPTRLHECGICKGRDITKGFFSVNALNAHIRDDHPAPPLPAESEEEKVIVPDNTAKVRQIRRPEPEASTDREKLSKEDLAQYLASNFAVGDSVTIQKIGRYFEDHDVSSAVEILRQRGAKGLEDKDRLVPIPGTRGRYWWAPAGVTLDADSGARARPEKVKPSAASTGRIFEVVNEFVDGQLLIRDEEGNLFTANLRPL